MSKPRKYKNPPLVEALCELVFADSRWDATVVGRVYERMQPAGFEKREPIEAAEDMPSLAVTRPRARSEPEPRTRVFSRDGSRVLQIGRDLLVINQLRPYPHFEEWQPTIVQAAEVYDQIAEPRGVRNIGLRYINRILLPGARVTLQDYFTIGPQIPKPWDDEHSQFFVRVQKQKGRDLTIMLTFGSAPSERPGESGFLLDIYARMAPDHPLRSGELTGALVRAHADVEESFEGSITPALRAIFEPDTP